ncbi:MAG TPA: hypothetical protein VFP03_08295, partial [Jiangellaceae bacterium]|nr:hypothetical protein [Jiangellaceae bacterium]
LHRNLTTAAHDWEHSGRDPAELYRGARLARALDWRQAAKPHLIPAEESFLDAGQELADTERRAAEDRNRATEARVREQARQNRRLRTALVAMAVTIAVALVAATTALVQSDRVADQRSQTARQSALRVLVSQANSLRGTQRDLAALLAIEANRLDAGPAGRSALFGTFTRDLGFEGSVPVREVESGVQSGVVQADGRGAMVVSADGVVHVVDLEQRTDTGARFSDPGFTAPSESRLALSADGTLLAQIGRNGRDIDTGDNWLVLYDVGTRTFRVPPVHLAAAVGDLTISPDGQWVVLAGGARAEVFIHRADTGSLVRTIPGLPEPEADLLNTAAVAFDPDGNLFVSSKAGTVRIFDPATLEQIGELPPFPQPGGATRQLAFTSDGQILVGISEIGAAAAWNVQARMLRWSGGTGQCLSISIGPGPNGQLYCGDPFGRITPLDVTSGQSSGQQLDTQLANEVRVIVTPDGTRLLYTSDDRPMLGVWRVDGGGPIQSVIAPHTEPTAYSLDGRKLLVELPDDGAQLWDPATGTLVNALERVSTALFFVGPDRLGVGLKDGTRGVYDYPADRMVWSRLTDLKVQGAEPDLGGNRLLVWYDGDVHRWFDVSTGEQVRADLPAGISIGAAAFTANGSHLAIIDPGEGLSVFDAITGEKVAGPVPDTASVAISRDGLLVASTHTGDLLFRDAATLEPRGQTVPAGAVLSDATLEFSADGSLLRASALHHTQLFDVATRTPLGEPVAIGERPSSGRPAGLRTDGAALSPDGEELALTAPGGVALWDLNAGRWVEAACQVASRNLTEDEWATYVGALAPYRDTCPRRT